MEGCYLAVQGRLDEGDVKIHAYVSFLRQYMLLWVRHQSMPTEMWKTGAEISFTAVNKAD